MIRSRFLFALLIVTSAPSLAAPVRPLKSRQHTTERNGVTIALWEKWYAGQENDWRRNGKVVLLVHGATWSSRCTFDPAENYSLMDRLAAAGYDVFAVDLHGYGKSGRTTNDLTDAASAVGDIETAVDYIRALRWVERVHIVGYQWGTQSVGLFAGRFPAKTGKLVLLGPRYKAFDRRASTPPSAPFRQNRSAQIAEEDADTEAEILAHRAQFCLAQDPQSPNGALHDLARPSTVNPADIKSPTLVLVGEREGEAHALQDRLDFYRALGTPSRWFAIVPGVGKYGLLERGRSRIEAAITSFLDQP